MPDAQGTRSLAAAQTVPKRGDVDANVEEHLRLAHAAAQEGARVLVFPELSLTGYELDLADRLAFSEPDARLVPLIELASSCSMTLVVGAPARIAARLHIGAFMISPDRSVELYTKHHLGAFPTDASPDGVVPPAEATVFQPGDQSPLVRFDGHTAAIAVCADTGRPSHAAAAAERGASTFLASMFFTPAELEGESARLRSYAVRHSMAVVLANHGGPSGGLAAAGGSAIWSEQGELLVQLEGSGSGVAVAIEGRAGWRARAVMLGGL
jgi:predicted amidohydrolase